MAQGLFFNALSAVTINTAGHTLSSKHPHSQHQLCLLLSRLTTAHCPHIAASGLWTPVIAAMCFTLVLSTTCKSTTGWQCLHS